MITVRDFIRELLKFNMDATVSINGLYDESENINFSWTGSDHDGGLEESKLVASHVFLETDNRNDTPEHKTNG